MKATQLWSEQHRPTSEEGLVVFKKRIESVRAFLLSGQRVLVLQGPPGSGKAATIRACCKNLGLEVLEWNPAAHSHAYSEDLDPDWRPEPMSNQFLRFLSGAGGGYQGIGTSGQRSGPRIALVQDVPFTLLQPKFLERLRELARLGIMQRVAFCFNDERDDHFAVRSILEQMESGTTQTIHFDGVARTFVQKALDNVKRIEGLVLDTTEISRECDGDLRQALNALQLASALPGARALQTSQTSGSVSRGRGRGRQTTRRAATRACPAPDFSCFPEQDALLGSGPPATPQAAVLPIAQAAPAATDAESSTKPTGLSDVKLGLFHALGRLLYNKRMPPASLVDNDGTGAGGAAGSSSGGAAKRRRQSPATAQLEPKQLPYEMLVPKITRPPLYFVPEEVLVAAGKDLRTVVDWLFTNAPRFYGSVGDLAEFSEQLSFADALGRTSSEGSLSAEEDRGEALRASICARALLDANLHPVKPVFGDPGSGPTALEKGGAPIFEMQRPRMRDLERVRLRRSERVHAGLLAVPPRALGSSSVAGSMLSRTLPHAHLQLCYTKGQHRTLGRLGMAMQETIIELNRFNGYFEDAPSENAATSVSATAHHETIDAKELPDDPIIDSD